MINRDAVHADQLEGYLPAQAGIPGMIDGRHPALAYPGKEMVTIDVVINIFH